MVDFVKPQHTARRFWHLHCSQCLELLIKYATPHRKTLNHTNSQLGEVAKCNFSFGQTTYG